MPLTAALALTVVMAVAPHRPGAAVAHPTAAAPPKLGALGDLQLSFSGLPERSHGGVEVRPQVGLRGGYLHSFGSGPVVGGELALRSFWYDHKGSSVVGVDTFQLAGQLGALAGYQVTTRTLTLTPHLAGGLRLNGEALRFIAPGGEAWRMRGVPGVYAGGGVMGSFHFALVRLEAALEIIDGRLVYRYDTGVGFYF